MKFFALALLALAAVASAKHINLEDAIDLEDISAYGYLSKIGAPLAEKIRKAEEEADIQGRVVGGSSSNIGQFPYMAGLLTQFSGGQSVCGGSLFRANRVVTAARCWFDGENRGTSITVVLGSIRIYSGGTRVTSTNIVLHGSWDPKLSRNDLAVIRLTANVGLTTNIAIIALPTAAQLNENYAGENAIASGFGRTGDSTTGAISTTQALSHVTLSVITNAVCSGSFSNILDSNICTSGTSGRSTCSGDTGGPLTVTRNSRPLLIGITSYGSIRGCEVGAPAVFTRVSSFVNWINTQ